VRRVECHEKKDEPQRHMAPPKAGKYTFVTKKSHTNKATMLVKE
jgi:hypothetical protein